MDEPQPDPQPHGSTEVATETLSGTRLSGILRDTNNDGTADSFDTATVAGFYAGTYGDEDDLRDPWSFIVLGDTDRVDDEFGVMSGALGGQELRLITYRLDAANLVLTVASNYRFTRSALGEVNAPHEDNNGTVSAVFDGDSIKITGAGDYAGHGLTVTPAAGYRFIPYRWDHSGGNTPFQFQFIAAEYVALGIAATSHNANITGNNFQSINLTFGRLTDSSDMPSAGVLSYNLGHATGTTAICLIDRCRLAGFVFFDDCHDFFGGGVDFVVDDDMIKNVFLRDLFARCRQTAFLHLAAFGGARI